MKKLKNNKHENVLYKLSTQGMALLSLAVVQASLYSAPSIKRHRNSSTPRARALSFFGAFLTATRQNTGRQASSTPRARALSLFGVLVLALFSSLNLYGAFSGTAHAATSEQLNFQGRLLDSSGSLVPDGIYNVQFDLYYVASGGVSQWTEDRLVTNTQGVTVQNGYFSVYLGEYDAFPALDWSEELYLGMTIRGTSNCAWGSCTPADSEMTPRFKLTSVPYAFTAANVASSDTDGADSSDISITTGDTTTSGDSGDIILDVGSAAGTAGSISLGATNASSILLGSSGVTTTVGGALTVTEAAVFNGNTTIGNANTDSLTINAGVAGATGADIIFGDASFQSCSLITDASGILDCGAVGASTLQGAYEGGNTILATDAEGSINLTVSQATNFSVDITGTGSFLVQDDGTNVLEVNDNAGVTINGNGTNTVLTGSIDPDGTTLVVGAGTAFTTELAIGDTILVSGEIRTVTAIASDTILAVSQAFSDSANDTSPELVPPALIVNDSSGDRVFVVGDNGPLSSEVSISTTADTSVGSSIFINDTGDVSSGIDTNVGQIIDVRRIGASGGNLISTGLYLNVNGDTGGTSTVYGVNSNATNGDTNIGVFGVSLNTGSATYGQANGVYGQAGGFGTLFSGTVTEANALRGILNSGNGTIATGAGLRINSANLGTGSITNNYGIIVEDQQNGTNNYGIVVEDASTYSLQLASDDGDAASGITFGTTGTANLYRSAANTLMTDDALTVTGNLTVGAGSSLIVVGGNNASIPGSPTEGEIYYDSENDELLIYNGSQWEQLNGNSSATFVVAASDSLNPELADYRADGTDDEEEIQDAIDALPASNGTVYLMEGTYNLSDGITLGATDRLIGSGEGSILFLNASRSSDINMINISNNSFVGHLRIDGNESNQSDTNALNGIYATGDSNVITAVRVDYIEDNGIVAETTADLLEISDSDFNGNNVAIFLTTGQGVIVNSNTFNSSTTQDITLFINLNVVLTNNVFVGSPIGIGSAGAGLGTIANNTFIGNTTSAMNLVNFGGVGTTRMIIDGNYIYDSGGATSNEAIVVGTAANTVSITNNYITDSSCTATCRAIHINTVSATGTYLSNNLIEVSIGTDQPTIADSGTDTVFASQVGAGDTLRSGSSLLRAYATRTLTGSIDPDGTTTVTGVSTKFLTELQVGDRITVTGETRTVTAIATDLSLTVDEAFSDNANDTSPDRLPAALVVQSSGGTVELIVQDNGYVGIGTISPDEELDVRGEVKVVNTLDNESEARSLFVSSTATSTTNSQSGIYSLVSYTPGSAPVASDLLIVGARNTVRANDNFPGTAQLIGTYGVGQNNGTGTAASVKGVQGNVQNITSGNITNARGVVGNVSNSSTGTIDSAVSLYANSTVNGGGGTITNSYGLYVADQTAGTNNYGIVVEDASTYSLQLASDDGDAASGITFGTTGTANLYRSAANTLFTDDSLTVGTNLQINGNTTIGSDNTDTITINAGSDGTGITFADASFQSCTLTTSAAGVLECGASASSLQGAYDGGNSITTASSTDIDFVLASGGFDIDISDDTDNSVSITRLNGVGTTDPAQLLLLDNADTDRSIADGLLVTAAAGGLVDGLDVSDSDITNAINIGANAIAGTNFNVDAAGAVTAVGVNAGAGLLQGTLGLTVSGAAISLNDSSNFATTINTGTSTGAVTIGGGNNTFELDSTTLDISTAGVISGATGLTSSGTINFSGLTASQAVFTDGSSNLVSTAASSALLASLTDETGTGVAVFNTSPEFTTSITTASGTFDLINANATALNIGGDATAISLGAATGTTAINNAATIGGNLTLLNGSDRVLSVQNQTTADTAGNALTVQSAAGLGTGVGGDLNLISGASGASGLAAGAVNITGGGSAGTGGAININGGDSSFIGLGGNITLTAGSNTNVSVDGAVLSLVGGNTVGAATTLTGAGGGAYTAGGVTIQGGSSGSGNFNGANVTLLGGAGVGTGTQGLVVVENLTFNTSTVENFTTSDTISQANVDATGAVIIDAQNPDLEIIVPNPTITTAGRLLYVTAEDGSNDFTLTLNDGSTEEVNISLRENETATLIWNGIDWTAAGASSSNTLQSAYNNTLTSAGGAEILLNAPGGDADGFTIRNNDVTPINGGILEIQSAIGTNLFSVNNIATEYAANGGAEDAATFSSDWNGTTGGASVTRETTTVATGTGSVQLDADTVNEGVVNNLATDLAASTQYMVSFAARTDSGTFDNADLQVFYSRDGGTDQEFCENASTSDFVSTTWTKFTCTIATDVTPASNAELWIRQTDSTTRTVYFDNLSITENSSSSEPDNVQIGGGIYGGPVTLFTLDRASAPPVADGNETFLGSMYYDTTSGRIQCYESDGWGACGSSPNNYVNLNPEYPGSVLNGTGVGTMTADFCAEELAPSTVLSVNTDFCDEGEAKNYYNWTSPQATQQTYSIYITYQLPAEFGGFDSNSTVQLTARTDDTDNGEVSYEMFRNESGVIEACGTETFVAGTNAPVTTADVWHTVGINGDEADGCNFSDTSADDFVIFKINMKANSNANVYVSTLSFTTIGQ